MRAVTLGALWHRSGGEREANGGVEAFKNEPLAQNLVAVGVGSPLEGWVNRKVGLFVADRPPDLREVFEQEEVANERRTAVFKAPLPEGDPQICGRADRLLG